MTLEWGPYEGEMTWDEAVKLAAAKGDGWRLPTVVELVSQYDHDADKPKDVDWKGWYWSSSPSGDSRAWNVGFDNGSVSNYLRGYELGVRCVREVGGISTPAMANALREARTAIELLRGLVDTLFQSRTHAESDSDTAFKERDEARAEVERLRDVVRQVHALSGVMNKWPDVIDLKECGAKIHKLTKDEP